jgi:prepilin-type N-terminal cleavage/methylation domain-containing protein
MFTRCADRRTRAGFSLIEILISVAIMLILASILLPRYFGGTDKNGKKTPSPRQRAQQVAGVSYIGQINQAISMYRMDHDNANPPTLWDLKTYGVTAEMLLDPVTRKPLTYNPQTGVVGNSSGLSQGPDSLGGGQTLPQVGN